MFQIEVNLDTRDPEALSRLGDRLLDRAELHEAMAERVSDAVRDHLAARQSPNTGWWQRAAKSVSFAFTADGGVVKIAQRGVALRFYGGTVTRKTGGPLLAIPTDKVPVANQTRRAPREMNPLAFLPSRSGGKDGHTVGYLVEGETYTVTRGKNKGSEGRRPKSGGALLYVLREQTTHQPDPSVLPDGLDQTAADALDDYLFPLS